MARKQSGNTASQALSELFASSRYLPLLSSTTALPIRGARQDIRSRLRAECPELPGVYGMVNSAGELIYVGMSRCLRKRLLSYFASTLSRKKEMRIGRRAKTLIWQPAAHELIAALRERELIRKYRPNFNVQGHPTRMKLGYITLVDQPAAAFSLQPRILKKQSGVWGPVPLTRYMRQAVQELNHHFQLRDCPRETPMRFKGESSSRDGEEASPCMRADLGTCLAPCIEACTRRAYSKSLSLARKFLDGDEKKTLDTIKASMTAAVTVRKYEKAAVLRDRLQALTRLDLHLRRFHDWTSHANFIYPVLSALDGQPLWLIVVRGALYEAIPRPKTHSDKQRVTHRLHELKSLFSGIPDRVQVTGPDEFESARILFRWFRLRPNEKPKRLSLAKARRFCNRRTKNSDTH